MVPEGLCASLFEPPQEKEEDVFLRVACIMRVCGRQSPHLDAARMEVAAASADEAGEALQCWGRIANETAYYLVQRLPAALRRLVFATLVRSGRAVCVTEAYERMLFLRQDMRAPQHREFYLRLNETLCFMDAQADLRACVQAHQIARQTPFLSHELRPCGSCGFVLRPLTRV